MDLGVVLQALVQGLQMGAIYALVTLSMTLIFSVSGLLNFAHGDLMVLAMYVAYLAYSVFGLDPYLSAAFIAMLFFGLGLVLFRFFVKPTLDSGVLAGAQLTLGFVFVIQNGILLGFGGDYISVPTMLSNRNLTLGTLSLPWSLLTGSVTALGLGGLLYFVLMKTDYGRQVRAITQNRDAAALMGVPIGRVQAIAFALGLALLGLTGPLIVAQFTLTPAMGLDFTLLALIVMVFGGIGNFIGTMVAGLIIGIVEGLGSLYFGGTVGAMVPYSVLILVLLFRPHGLFGEH